MTGAHGSLLRWLRPRDQAPILLAIPQAGSGAHYFQRLQRELATTATVLGVQLPGRSDRWNEPMPDGITSLLNDLAGELAAELAGSPALLLGCSFGGLLGYELLRQFPQLSITGIVLASCRAPRWWLEGAITDAERDLLLRGVRQVTVDFDLDEDSRRFLERPLLADIELARTLPRDAAASRIDLPVLAIRGRTDPLVSHAQLAEWADRTTAGMRQLEFEAGHDLVQEAAGPLAEAIRSCLVASQP